MQKCGDDQQCLVNTNLLIALVASDECIFCPVFIPLKSWADDNFFTK